MTAQILTPFSTQANTFAVARQEWKLAQKHYREICERYDARFPESVATFQAAVERQEAAFDTYMRAFHGQ